MTEAVWIFTSGVFVGSILEAWFGARVRAAGQRAAEHLVARWRR